MVLNEFRHAFGRVTITGYSNGATRISFLSRLHAHAYQTRYWKRAALYVGGGSTPQNSGTCCPVL